LSSSDTSIGEFKAYFGIAMQLTEYDTARELLVKWERGQPEDMSARNSRIELEIATGNLEAAWKLVNSLLAVLPNDAEAVAERQTIQQKLAKLNILIHVSLSPAP
jgi:predicted Zn-dependent protease